MKFGDILINNFLGLAEARVVLGNRGLVNIEGVNGDDPSAKSNGAGKSSLADALCWCLFGVTARGAKGDEVVNHTAGKGTLVDVELLEGDDQWKVVRHRKHKTGKNAVHLFHYAADGTATDLTKGTDALTQAEIDRIVGCPYEVFRSAVYAGQEQMPDLPGMTDKNLKVLVEEAAGVTLLERAYGRANQAVAAAKEALNTATHRLTLGASQREALDAAITHLEEKAAEAAEAKADRLKAVADQINTSLTHARTLGLQLEEFDEEAIRGSIQTIDDRLAAIGGEKARLKELEDAVTKASLALARINSSRHTLARQARSEKEGFDHLDGQVGCPCHGCQRPFTAEDIAPAKAAAATKLRTTIAAAKQAASDETTAIAAVEAAEAARDAYAATMTDTSKAVESRREWQKTLDNLEALKRERGTHLANAKRYQEEERRLNAEANPFDKTIEESIAKRKAAEEAVEKLRAGVIASEEELQLAQETAAVFAPAGVRAHILDTVTPFLNDRTARYLGTLSDGNIAATWTTLVKNAKGELREKFAIEVANDKGGRSFTLISGGEKRKVRIACALALQDLVASRATKPIELFIGDEIDNALDSAGLERLMTVLEEKARERGSVFIISHGDLKDWIRTTITVTKKGGVSTIEEIAA